MSALAGTVLVAFLQGCVTSAPLEFQRARAAAGQNERLPGGRATAIIGTGSVNFS